MNFIIDPNTGIKYNIFTRTGQNMLKNYIKYFYKKGGSDETESGSGSESRSEPEGESESESNPKPGEEELELAFEGQDEQQQQQQQQQQEQEQEQQQQQQQQQQQEQEQQQPKHEERQDPIKIIDMLKKVFTKEPTEDFTMVKLTIDVFLNEFIKMDEHKELFNKMLNELEKEENNDVPNMIENVDLTKEQVTQNGGTVNNELKYVFDNFTL